MLIIYFTAAMPLISWAEDSLVVVVPKGSTIDNLTEDDIANIFLARTKYYPNGERSIPIELKRGKQRDEFYQLIAGKNTKQLMAYWTTLVFTGKGRPPKSYNELDALLEQLPSEVSYITYLDSEQVTDNMKVVYRFPTKM